MIFCFIDIDPQEDIVDEGFSHVLCIFIDILILTAVFIKRQSVVDGLHDDLMEFLWDSQIFVVCALGHCHGAVIADTQLEVIVVGSGNNLQHCKHGLCFTFIVLISQFCLIELFTVEFPMKLIILKYSCIQCLYGFLQASLTF